MYFHFPQTLHSLTMEMSRAFQFETPSSILVVGPSGYGNTCFTWVLLLHQSNDLFADVPSSVAYRYSARRDRFVPLKKIGTMGFQILVSWRHGGLAIRDDLMAEGENDTKTLDLFPKHSHHQNITVLYYVKIYFYKENTSRVFWGMLITW